MIKKGSEKTHHFREEIYKNVIIHHNKKIIERISESLDNVYEVSNKNYFTLNGEYEGSKITLIATGMGAGNTGIVVDQVIKKGTKNIFKFGTFGALQDNIKVGDIYLPTGAVRAEGLTDAYAPIYYPAIPSQSLLNKVICEFEKLEINDLNFGVVHSVNIYSPYYENTFAPLKYSPEEYKKIGVFGVEMETSTAFVCSGVKNVNCVSILICNREWETQKNYSKGKEVNWDKHQTEKIKDENTQKSIMAILETIKNL